MVVKGVQAVEHCVEAAWGRISLRSDCAVITRSFPLACSSWQVRGRTFIVLGSRKHHWARACKQCATRGTLRGGKEAVVGRVVKGLAIHCYVVSHHRVCVHIGPIATPL